jgi:hypothetical protein
MMPSTNRRSGVRSGSARRRVRMGEQPRSSSSCITPRIEAGERPSRQRLESAVRARDRPDHPAEDLPHAVRQFANRLPHAHASGIALLLGLGTAPKRHPLRACTA